MDQYYVIGDPVDHSLSALIHTAFAKQMGLSLQYDQLRVPKDNVAAILRQFLSNGVRGCSVTVPDKLVAMQCCDMVSERAKQAQAVSGLKFSNGKIIGENFDGVGLVAALRDYHQVSLQNKKLLVLGAGGAAQGILPALLSSWPSSIIVANRTLTKAQQLVAGYQNEKTSVIASNLARLSGSFDIVINATAAGLSGELPEIDSHFIQNTVCYDLMYSKTGKTDFCQWADARGAQSSHDGLSMLISLSEMTFKWWTDRRPDGRLLYKTLKTQSS